MCNSVQQDQFTAQVLLDSWFLCQPHSIRVYKKINRYYCNLVWALWGLQSPCAINSLMKCLVTPLYIIQIRKQDKVCYLWINWCMKMWWVHRQSLSLYNILFSFSGSQEFCFPHKRMSRMNAVLDFWVPSCCIACASWAHPFSLHILDYCDLFLWVKNLVTSLRFRNRSTFKNTHLDLFLLYFQFQWQIIMMCLVLEETPLHPK